MIGYRHTFNNLTIYDTNGYESRYLLQAIIIIGTKKGKAYCSI